jgi:hypothetical protein
LTLIGDQNVNEDEQLNISISYSDPDEDDLSVSVTSSNPEVVVNLDGELLTIVPSPNYNGSSIVTVTVSETEGYQTTESFNVIVNAVNDAPTMLTQSDITTAEEESITISLNATDIDGDTDFTFSVSVDANLQLLDFSLNGSDLTLIPSQNQWGIATIYVSANDGQYESRTSMMLLNSRPFQILQKCMKMVIIYQ